MAIVTKIAFLAVCVAAVGEDASLSENSLASLSESDQLERDEDVSESTGPWGKQKPHWFSHKVHLKRKTTTQVIHKKIIHKIVKILTADQNRIHEVKQQLMKEGVSGVPIGVVTEGMAEGIGMFGIVFITCGTAMSVPDQSHKLVHVSLVAGLVYTVMSYAIGHYSGAQLNCAVTFGLHTAGHISSFQAFVYVIFQLVGSYCGALALTFIFSAEADETSPHFLHTNYIHSGWAWWQAYFGEFMMTMFIVYVFIETCANPESRDNRAEAYLAIGFAYFAAHCVLLPVDGCCVNPSRNFGPTCARRLFRAGGKMAYISQLWIFWSAPLLGGAFAALMYKCVHQRQVLEQLTGAATGER